MSDTIDRDAWVKEQVDRVYPQLLKTSTPCSRHALENLYEGVWDDNHAPRWVVAVRGDAGSAVVSARIIGALTADAGAQTRLPATTGYRQR